MANPTPPPSGQTPTVNASTGFVTGFTPTNMLVEAFKGDTLSAALAGWGILFVVLMFLASFDSTAPMAAAFAWLIFVAVVLVNGEKLLA